MYFPQSGERFLCQIFNDAFGIKNILWRIDELLGKDLETTTVAW
jgi:hypothetical protein